jgi:hypothetical protein
MNYKTVKQGYFLKSMALLFTTLSVTAFMWNSSPAQAQNRETSSTPLTLEGKTFVLSIYTFDTSVARISPPAVSEITFLNGKFHLKTNGSVIKDGTYTCRPEDNSGSISFVFFSTRENGDNDIFWKGKMNNNRISGTLNWFSAGQTFMFSGSLKYQDEKK